MVYSYRFLPGVLLVLSGCVSGAVTETVGFVNTFSTATETQLTAAEKILAEKRSDPEIVKARQNIMADQFVYYGFHDDRCDLTNPIDYNTLPEGEKPESRLFRESCRLVLLKRNDDGVPEPFGFGTEDVRVSAVENAPVVAASLRHYVEGLGGIADATSRDRIAADAKRTIGSLATLRDAVRAVFGDKAPKPEDAAIAEAGADLISRLAAATVDLYRYEALQSIVPAADTDVSNAVAILGVALDTLYPKDFDKLVSEREELRIAVGELRNQTTQDQSTQQTDTAARADLLRTIDAAKASLDKADSERLALKVLQIADTHAAIADNLTEPKDAASHSRSAAELSALAKATREFVTAIEDR